LFTFYILLTRWFFIHLGFWINIVYPLGTIILIYISFTLYRYVVEEKNKRFLYTTFSSYLAPELIEYMVKKEAMPELGGEARNVTAYFTDIQNFSTLSEYLTSQHLIKLLNEYLTAMTDILIAEHGTLDKYVGDAIIAIFGAPMQMPDHPYRACKTAVAMQNKLNDLCKKWSDEKQAVDEPSRNIKNLPNDIWRAGDKWPRIAHDMKMRIGINTGEIVVGNMGSAMRMNYSMTGDAVNLAARLEQAAKLFGIYTVISEYTMDSIFFDEDGIKKRVRDVVEARFIDNIVVKGKTEAVNIYELCAMKGNISKQEEKLFKVFNQGMRHYFNMDWDSATKYFIESSRVERFPENQISPSNVYIKRCKKYKEQPAAALDEKWDRISKAYRCKEVTQE
jgi:adenylate cyclase